MKPTLLLLDYHLLIVFRLLVITVAGLGVIVRFHCVFTIACMVPGGTIRRRTRQWHVESWLVVISRHR